MMFYYCFISNIRGINLSILFHKKKKKNIGNLFTIAFFPDTVDEYDYYFYREATVISVMLLPK